MKMLLIGVADPHSFDPDLAF